MIRRSRKKAVKGEEYRFEHVGVIYALGGWFVEDPTVPEGRRWVATRDSNRVIRVVVCQLANERCELRNHPRCWKWAPVKIGHPHHVIHKKMGGANTDDRIWIMVNGREQRIRVWACPQCHQEHHGPLAWAGQKRA